MINVNELKLSNYVFDDNMRIIKVMAIYQDGVGFNFNDEVGFIDNKFIEPIELTKLILIQSGFELIGVNWHFEGKNIWKCRDMFICDRFGTEIKYVHELQNWYYVNSNKKELTIQL